MSAGTAKNEVGSVNEELEPGSPSLDGYSEVEDTLEPGYGENKQNRTVADALGRDKEEVSARLWIGESATGSLADAHDAYAGLNTFLKKNGYDEILESVNWGGGLQLEHPNRWGKDQSTRQKFFGKDPKKDTVPDDMRLLDIADLLDNEEKIEKYEEQLEGQINNSSDLQDYARQRTGELLDGLDVDINYSTGEEERRFNITEEEETFLKTLAEDIQEQIDYFEDKYDTERERYEALLNYIDSLDEKALKNVQGFADTFTNWYNAKAGEPSEQEIREKKNELLGEYGGIEGAETEQIPIKDEDGVDVGDYTHDELSPSETEKISELSAEWEDIVNLIDPENFEYEQFRSEYKDVRDRYQTFIQGKRNNVLSNIKDKKDQFKEKKGKLKSEQDDELAFLANNRQIDIGTTKVLGWIAEDEILEDLTKKFNPDYRENLSIQNEKRALIDEGRGTSEDEESFFGDAWMFHNTKWSRTPSKYSWKEALEEVQDEFRHADFDAGEIPDTVVVPHATGGFRYGRFDIGGMDFPGMEEIPESKEVTVMTLPAFQDEEKIRDLYHEGVRNNHTKRIYKDSDGNGHSFGAVLQLRYEDGTETPIWLGEESLSELGEMTREVSQNGDKELEREIEDYTAVDMGAVTSFNDWHLGKAFHGHGLSYRDKIRRTINYAIEEFNDFEIPLAAILGGDMIDGDQNWGGKDGYGHALGTTAMRNKTAEKISEETDLVETKREIEEYYSEFDVSPWEVEGEEKDEIMGMLDPEDRQELFNLELEFQNELWNAKDIWENKATENGEKSPLQGHGDQWREFEEIAKDLVLDLDHKLEIWLAGNHPDSDAGTDEGERIRDKTGRIRFNAGQGPEDEPITWKIGSGGQRRGGFEGTSDKDDKFFGKLIEGSGRNHYFQHEMKGGKHYMKAADKILDDKRVHEGHFQHIHTPGMMINNTRAAVVHPSVVNTDERQETTGYAHNTWGNMTKIFNGSSEEDRSSDMQFHAGLWTGPETLKKDEWAGDSLDEELDEVRTAMEAGNLMET